MEYGHLILVTVTVYYMRSWGARLHFEQTNTSMAWLIFGINLLSGIVGTRLEHVCCLECFSLHDRDNALHFPVHS